MGKVGKKYVYVMFVFIERFICYTVVSGEQWATCADVSTDMVQVYLQQ